jgi:hypothetical protein
MGWRGRVWRIWSTDWFRSPRQEAMKLVSFLDNLRKTWKPEHSSGQSWIEVGKKDGAYDGNGSRNLDDIGLSLADFDDEPAVRVGDIVRYIDVKKVDDVLTVQITGDKTDVSAGFVHRGTPLAQTLLGAVAGDEVTMHLPGVTARIFRILEVKRDRNRA